MLAKAEEIACGVIRCIMGRRLHHKFATNFYGLRSAVGVKTLGVMLIFIFCLLMYGPSLSFTKQATLYDVTVKFEIAANPATVDSKICQDAEARICSLVKLHLFYNGKVHLKDTKWSMYFSIVRRIVDIKTDEFEWTHVNGDLNFVKPTANFKGFAPNSHTVIPLVIEHYMLAYSDVMPNCYFVQDSGEIVVVDNTRNNKLFASGLKGDNVKRSKDDYSEILDSEKRFAKNAESRIPLLEREEIETLPIPTPKSIKVGKGRADISGGVILMGEGWDSFTKDQKEVITSRFQGYDIQVRDETDEGKGKVHTIIVRESKPMVDGSEIDPYNVKMTPFSTVITGSKTGMFYGLQTFLSLVSMDVQSLPVLEISDSARFEHRSFMLDVARHFKSKFTIFQILDQMAAYKLNVFNFHLTDDEGWRIEIPGLPELTQYGSKRCHDTSQCLIPQLGSGPYRNNLGTGYYTVSDYKEILQYAKIRGIKVIPEIDMPGHARAAVMAMEHRYHNHRYADPKGATHYRLLDPHDDTIMLSVQFFDKTTAMNPCIDSTYNFIHKVVAELKQIHSDAGVDLEEFNMGGDEVKSVIPVHKPWEKSSQCIEKGFHHKQLIEYFMKRVKNIFTKLNIHKVYAWSDIVGSPPVPSSKFEGKSGIGLHLNMWNVLEWDGLAKFQDLANAGYKLINNMPDYLYFDMPQEPSVREKGFYWATRFTDLYKVFAFNPVCIGQNGEYSKDRQGNPYRDQEMYVWPSYHKKAFTWEGMQCNLWGETIRTDEDMFYMIFPRLIAFAERAWHKGPWELNEGECVGKVFGTGTGKLITDLSLLKKQYTLFTNIIIQREFPKLDELQIGYRVPPPGYKIESGKLEANVEFEGFLIQVSLDGGKNWFYYDEKEKPSVEDLDLVRVRTITHSGKQFSRDVGPRDA